MNRKDQYSRPSCTTSSDLLLFNTETIYFLFYKTSYLNVEVNRSQPSLREGFPDMVLGECDGEKSILKGCMTFDHEVCIPDTFSPAELLKLIWLRNGTKCYLELIFLDHKSYRISTLYFSATFYRFQNKDSSHTACPSVVAQW
jgi:hypothetical protein